MTTQLPGSNVQIEMLGRFRVVVGGKELGAGAWSGRRAAELVQLLALADDHRLARDAVIEALWAHLEVNAGAANLRKAAHHARAALAATDAVVLRDGQVWLFPDGSVQTDVEQFEVAAAKAHAADDGKACATAAGLYGGDLLPGSLYEEWTQAPRERLRARFAEVLRCSGQWERLVELEPTDEPACRELMRRDLAAGSRPSAIRWYGRLRSALRAELGMAPSRETEAIYNECVAGFGVDAPSFVGRQLELAKVASLLRSEPSGTLEALLVRGPAGIGKSALCREIGRIAEAEGWTAVSALATEVASPYAPLAGAVEQLVGADPSLLDVVGGRARSVLAELTPLAAPAEALGRALTRHEVIGAVRRLLVAAGHGGPVALLVDDAHLADEATIDLLVNLGSPGGTQVLVALAYRPEAAGETLTRAVARLARGLNTVEIDLAPLDREDVSALVAAAAPTSRTPEVVERIVDLAQGNPFLTLEVARSPVAGVPSLAPTARDAVISRLVDLGEEETEALGRLALAGDALDPSSIVALTGSAESDGFAMLDLALSAGVLIVSDARYRFRHELVRQALVERIPPHKRLAIHREMADQLTEAEAAPGLIAHQWLEGGRPEEARDWLLSAALAAVKLGAYADALADLERLLEHEPEQDKALSMRAEVLDAMGDTRAPAAYAKAAELIGGQPAHELRAKQALATVKLGDPPGALRVLEGVEPVSVEGRLAEALAHCGCAALGHADPEVGTDKAAEARRLALETGDSDSLLIASWANAAAAHARGDLRGSVLADLEETQDLPKLAVSVFDGQLCITQRLLYGARPYTDVISFMDSFAAEAERLGAARGRAFAVTLRGEARLLAGELDEADADLACGAELHREISAATGEAFALQRRSEVALGRGDRGEAGALLDQALAVARESDVGFHLLDRIYGTRIALASDADSALAAVEEAEGAVRGPIETCPGCRITLAVPAAIATARYGDPDQADRWERDSEYLANVVMRLPAWYAALDEIRGHRAQTSGNVRAAHEHFQAAAEGYGAAGQRLDAERCAGLAETSAGGK